MTIYYPDVSSYQRDIDLHGTVAVSVKATEGTGYVNPDYGRAIANAEGHGAFAFAYHFLHAGAAAAQAAFCYWVVGKRPLMLDFELSSDRPSLTDACAFVDAYRKLGGTCWLVYLPEWYWGQLGRPSLKPLMDRGLLLVSSNYVGYTDSDSGAGWQSYGGMTPAIWQYTSTLLFNGYRVDFNAYRGRFAGKQDAGSVAACLADFKALVSTGKLASSPTAPSVKLALTPNAGNVPFVVTADFTGSSAGTGGVYDCKIGWGDGTGWFHGGLTSRWHTYRTPGSYTVDVYVTNGAGKTTHTAGQVAASAVKYVGEYITDGKLSAAGIEAALRHSFATICRWTAIHYGAFDGGLAAYIDGLAAGTVKPADPIEAGVHLWME